MNVTENGSFLLHFFLKCSRRTIISGAQMLLENQTTHRTKRFSELHRLETIRLGLFEKER